MSDQKALAQHGFEHWRPAEGVISFKARRVDAVTRRAATPGTGWAV